MDAKRLGGLGETGTFGADWDGANVVDTASVGITREAALGGKVGCCCGMLLCGGPVCTGIWGDDVTGGVKEMVTAAPEVVGVAAANGGEVGVGGTARGTRSGAMGLATPEASTSDITTPLDCARGFT